MIVTCPNCDTSYNLPDEKIPAGGAKVKCSKCAHVFKVDLPPASPEEEFESLLEDEGRETDGNAGEAFDETFEDVAAGAEAGPEAASDRADEVVEDIPDTDGLFDDEDEASGAEEGGAAEPGEGEDDLFADMGEDESGDLFADGGEEDDGDLFEDTDEAEPDDSRALFDADDEAEADEDKDEVLAGGLGGSLELDEEPKSGNSRKSLGCLIVLLVLVVGIGAAVYFKVWTMAGVDLADMLKNVPFVGQLFMEETGGGEATAPGESPAERVRKIELKNVKQYYVTNEKVGNLFVVEGKAVNKFSKPKERIKVEVILYDASNNVLTSQAFLCGNVLSQFQLQVQTEKEITDGLASDVGILSNNTFIRPGASTPFMAVFFTPPEGVKEFMVKVVDVGDPE